MAEVIDVRDTERANIFISGFQQDVCKISHLMAMSRVMQRNGTIPDEVDVIRPAEGIDGPDTIRVLHDVDDSDYREYDDYDIEPH